MIRDVKPGDSGQICRIYNHYIENTIITFEEESLEPGEMERRIREVTKEHPWIVFEEEGRILGYAYAHTWRSRSAFRFSLESTVYLDPGEMGKGIGTRLYSRLLQLLKDQGIHMVIGVLSLPNEGSRKLHEKFGFKKVAHYREVGLKFGKWIDIGSWQLNLQDNP
jgi:phosphinothricin acetyltransferase